MDNTQGRVTQSRLSQTKPESRLRTLGEIDANNDYAHLVPSLFSTLG
jgi:hypothetical protein